MNGVDRTNTNSKSVHVYCIVQLVTSMADFTQAVSAVLAQTA